MSSQTQDEIQTLTRLGLTLYQAKAFLALEQSGTLSAKILAKNSGVPREKIYQILATLMEMGIVNKVVDVPAKFKAEPLSEAVKILLSRKKNDYTDLCTKATTMLDHYQLKHKTVSETDSSKILLVSNKEAITGCIRKSIKTTNDSISLVTSWKKFSQLAAFSDEIKNCQKTGVKIRVVVQIPERHQALKEIIKSMGISESHCRTIQDTLPALVYLYDNERALIFTEEEKGEKESQALVTNNRSMLALARTYFEKMWKIGTDLTSCGNLDFPSIAQ